MYCVDSVCLMEHTSYPSVGETAAVANTVRKRYLHFLLLPILVSLPFFLAEIYRLFRLRGLYFGFSLLSENIFNFVIIFNDAFIIFKSIPVKIAHFAIENESSKLLGF